MLYYILFVKVGIENLKEIFVKVVFVIKFNVEVIWIFW